MNGDGQGPCRQGGRSTLRKGDYALLLLCFVSINLDGAGFNHGK
jgi:hypothetical protein